MKSKYITSKEIALEGLHLTAKNGGATINPKTGESVTAGYAVGGIREFKFYHATMDDLEEITAAITKIRCSHPKMDIGFWLDDGTLYLDAIAVMATEDSARVVAEAFDEIAFFHLDTNTEIRLK